MVMGYAILTLSMVIYLPVKISSMLFIMLNGRFCEKLEHLRNELVTLLKQRISCW
jgi:hypothetical protein